MDSIEDQKKRRDARYQRLRADEPHLLEQAIGFASTVNLEDDPLRVRATIEDFAVDLALEALDRGLFSCDCGVDQ